MPSWGRSCPAWERRRVARRAPKPPCKGSWADSNSEVSSSAGAPPPRLLDRGTTGTGSPGEARRRFRTTPGGGGPGQSPLTRGRFVGQGQAQPRQALRDSLPLARAEGLQRLGRQVPAQAEQRQAALDAPDDPRDRRPVPVNRAEPEDLGLQRVGPRRVVPAGGGRKAARTTPG